MSKMDVFERYKEQLIKLIDDHPIDIINKIRPLTAQFFPKANTSPSSLRQRALMMILKVYELNKESAYRSFVNTILEEILFCVSSFLENQKEEYLKTLSTVEFTCPQMVEDSVPIILKLQPKKSISAIKALYKLSDENCDMALIFKRELKKKMLDLPELTIEWIHCLKFDEFKKRYFEDLIVTIIVKRLDLKDLLIKDGYEARKVIQFLDKSLDRRAFKGELFNVLRGMLKDVEITKIILKIATEYSISTTYYPNAVIKRRLADFLYNLHQRGKEEYSHLSVHSLQEFNEIGNFDVIRALAKWEKTDKYAGIAFGRIYGLNDDELARINPEYKDVMNWDEEKIVTKMNEFNYALTAEAYIHEFLIEGNFTVILIDDSEKLRFAMKKLSESEKIAFGVEANYDGVQQACLLQIALKESVLLIDIYTLIQNVCAEHIKIFFEMFLGCDADRIVFDFRSDLSLLRRTFNWMPEYLQRIQPKFHCVQRFVKLVGTSDTYKEIFETVPNPSLKEVAAKWLEKDLSKGERQGNNWLKRPLSKEKMVCAAKNARATMDLYYFIQKKLAERNLHDDMSTLIVAPKQIDRKRIKRKNGEKETMEEILENVEAKIKEMKETLYTFEKSENVTIVVDSGFLSIAPFLQQFGYKTFDQRNCENGEHFSRDEVIATLSKFMEDRIADGTITHCYLLTDEYSNIRFKNKVQIDELKIINCGIDETESSIICAIMYDTNTIFDLTEVGKQCTKCGEFAYVFDFPADIFKVIFIHYAQVKQFVHKLQCKDNSSKLLENLERKNVVEIHGQMMVYRITELCVVCFNLGNEILGELKYFDENGEEIVERKNYKCNIRFFEKIGDKSHVRFCVDCFEFF